MCEKFVLIIEDERMIGTATGDLLRTRDIESRWIVGLRLENPFEGDRIHGIKPDGTPVELDPAEYSVALVDGALAGKGLQGWQIIPFLKEHGIICVGLSGNWDTLDLHREAGAEATLLKPIQWTWFTNDLPQLIAQHARRSIGA